MPKLKTQTTEPKTAADLTAPGSNSRAQLYSFVERLERLDEERQGLVDDAKEVRAEAKGMGYDTKILGVVLRRRKMDKADLLEADSLLEMYEEAIRDAEALEFAKSEQDAT